MIRVTHLLTNGGRLDGTERVLWARDMTDEEYDRYLDQGRKQLEQREKRSSEQALLSRISDLAMELTKVVELKTARELMGLLQQYESRMVVRGEDPFPF